MTCCGWRLYLGGDICETVRQGVLCDEREWSECGWF
jgi:hypothetical protein